MVLLSIDPALMLQKLKLEYDDFDKDPKNWRHAINFAITAYHLKEWIWKYYSSNNNFRRSLGKEIKNKNAFNTYLSKRCPELKIIREICNASKHVYIENTNVKSTRNEVGTWEECDLQWDRMDFPWEYDGILFEDSKNNFRSLLDVFKKVKDSWDIFFSEYITPINKVR